MNHYLITSFVIGLILLLVIVATIHDLIWNTANLIQNEANNQLISLTQRIINFLYCFSAKRNVQAFLSTQVNSDTEHLLCLNGIRVI